MNFPDEDDEGCQPAWTRIRTPSPVFSRTTYNYYTPPPHVQKAAPECERMMPVSAHNATPRMTPVSAHSATPMCLMMPAAVKQTCTPAVVPVASHAEDMSCLATTPQGLPGNLLGTLAGTFHDVISLGSVGHPYSCNLPCKYANRAKGCKDGHACDHCHLCKWIRSRKPLARMPL
eukprot:TRINITY_DN5662_c0_g1_i1.p2 TRINITY_DN5662_c0_g1~~TRINITY_DN5662_c0_g1_i1.p2  ORF type:complete len:175 (-),score=23.10 TRINITY_DN5662_c0_g1_i1:81-605(-)